MATEDQRYRMSSQFRLWSFSPSGLDDLRSKTNSLARQQITPRLPDPPPEFLTPDEELQLVKFFTVELIRAAAFCELPTEVRATAAVFLRRFYVTNSVMTYPPTELLKTSLFFGSKADGFYMRLGKLAEKFPNTTAEQILAGEFLLCQGIRFAFDVRHPFRALDGAIMELRRLDTETTSGGGRGSGVGGGSKEKGAEEERIAIAHARARDVLKFSPLVTDVYFHYTPSQIMMAALLIVDEGLVDRLIPAETPGTLREKMMGAIQKCKAMLLEEPPERMTEYWGNPDVVKSMKPLRRKLQKCRDPDRADLVALQKARREQAVAQDKKPGATGVGEVPDAKRRKVNADDVFGGPLQ